MTKSSTRIALITGGAAGMGLASARALVADGHAVVIADKDGTAAENAANELRQGGGAAVAHRVDAASLPELRSLFASVEKSFGRLDVFFSNVGIPGPDGYEVTEQQFDEVLKVNLQSQFFATTMAVPLMSHSAPRASIIYMSSAAGLRPGGPSPLYSISKASILMMMRSFAHDLGPAGIRVNALCPGHIETAFPRKWIGLDEEDYQALIQRRISAIPLRRIGYPEDVADVVRFLASDQSRYLTGLAIPIDGGRSA